jgi:hypothetical protein
MVRAVRRVSVSPIVFLAALVGTLVLVTARAGDPGSTSPTGTAPATPAPIVRPAQAATPTLRAAQFEDGYPALRRSSRVASVRR